MNEGSTDHYNDPYTGDVANGLIYFTDRNQRVYSIPMNSNKEITPGEDLLQYQLVANGELGYYGAYGLNPGGYGYGWGALNGDFQVIDGQYWWGKSSNHKGLWRFEDDDINKRLTEGCAR